jgi:hypothetical protein
MVSSWLQKKCKFSAAKKCKFSAAKKMPEKWRPPRPKKSKINLDAGADGRGKTGTNNQPKRKAPNIGKRRACVQDRERAMPMNFNEKSKRGGNEMEKIGERVKVELRGANA